MVRGKWVIPWQIDIAVAPSTSDFEETIRPGGNRGPRTRLCKFSSIGRTVMNKAARIWASLDKTELFDIFTSNPF